MRMQTLEERLRPAAPARPPAWARAAFAVAAIALLVGAYWPYRTFYSRYYFMRASWGVHGEDTYQKRLAAALRDDPSFGEAHLAMANLMMRRAKYGAALQSQHTGMESFRPQKAYVQEGLIHERLGDLDAAARVLEKALTMHPGDVRTLEGLALVALRRRNSDDVGRLTAEILRRDMNNPNAYYLRAKDAEAAGNLQAAFSNYQRVGAAVTQRKMPAGTLLFRAQEIEERLAALKAALRREPRRK